MPSRNFYDTKLYLAVLQSERLLLVTKWLSPEIVRNYQINWRCIERNIRATSTGAWRMNLPFLEKLLRRLTSSTPASSREFYKQR